METAYCSGENNHRLSTLEREEYLKKPSGRELDHGFDKEAPEPNVDDGDSYIETQYPPLNLSEDLHARESTTFRAHVMRARSELIIFGAHFAHLLQPRPVNHSAVESRVRTTALSALTERNVSSTYETRERVSINSTELPPAQKNDAVQMLETVAADAARPKEQRRSAAMRAVLSGVAEIVQVGASLSALWERLGPTILSAF